MNEICIRVKELRKDLHMSQVEFAKKLGVTNAHISKIEKGGTVPSDTLIKLISKEYDVNEDWLKKGIEPIYIDEILDKTEEQLTTSTETFNKLLRCDSYVIRGLAAELNFYFSSITDVEGLGDTEKIEYLTIVKEMFSLINQFNLVLKDSIYTKQTVIPDVMDSHFSNYKLNMERCINKYKELVKHNV